MQNTRFAKVLSSIFAAESGISSFNFLYLLNIRNLSNLPYHQRKMQKTFCILYFGCFASLPMSFFSNFIS